MAEEEYKPAGEEEYEFSELGDSDLFGGADDKSDKKNLIQRLVLLGVGVLLLVFVVYKLMGMFFSDEVARDLVTTRTDSPITQPATPPMTTQPAVPTTPTPPPTATTQTPTATQTRPTDADTYRSEIRSLSQQVTASSANVETLNSGIDDVKETLKAMRDKLNMMNDNIDNLSEEVMRQRRVITNMQAKRRRAKRARMKRTAHRRPRWYLRAVFPGADSPRAWLIGPKDQTLTVRQGSRIKGYGVVLRIKPQEGEILTSSGAIIRYSEADR